jgi:hypothetical protein
MEPENSLPCLQEPSTSPYPEPDQSTLYHSILSLSLSLSKIHFYIIHLRFGLPSGLFPSGFPTKIYAFLFDTYHINLNLK